MPETQYPKNPNTDTAFVTDDQGKRTRAVKTVVLDGTIDYPKNSNSTDCYVTVDGKKQRALMTADISSEGTVEYPTNSNSTKGYITVNGKKQRVVLTASLVGGGSTPVIEELNVTPSTSAQVITAPSGTDGYSPVNVAAVTSSIDANITAGNIKKDVQILGVTGSYEGTTPTGTMYIISNGTYNVADKAIANVNVPTAPQIYRVFRDNNGKLDNSITTPFLPLPNTITDIGAYCLAYAYRNTPSSVLSGAIDLSSLTKISGSYACFFIFSGCTGITSANLSSLTTISGNSACSSMFKDCTGITSFDLSSLTTISGSTDACRSMFSGCTGITSANLSSLTTISGSTACLFMFSGCTSLATLYIGGTTTINFGGNTNIFDHMFQNCTQNIDVYAPAGNQAAITAMSGYPNFDGTGTVTWHWRS